MFGVHFRDELPDVVVREFEALTSAVGQAFTTEHNDDGTHINPPVGSIVLWPAIPPPEGWLVCDGRSVYQTDYPALFKVLGIRFGTAASGAFTLPNLTPPSDTVYIIYAGL